MRRSVGIRIRVGGGLCPAAGAAAHYAGAIVTRISAAAGGGRAKRPGSTTRSGRVPAAAKAGAALEDIQEWGALAAMRAQPRCVPTSRCQHDGSNRG